MIVCFYRLAQQWVRAGVFKSNEKRHRRLRTGSDFGVLGEKHWRTQSEFERIRPDICDRLFDNSPLIINNTFLKQTKTTLSS